ncbi:MAG: hypothetical protein K0Q56_2464 [Sporolactobacillus laevolacticus]|jgi:hypothetical protein|nr:hypothetical protein [Sporolactobacillus laevolacticus]
MSKLMYQAFGLTISSDILFPELCSVTLPEQTPDVSIKFGDLQTVWADQATPNDHFVANADYVLFKIASTALFRIQDGEKIVISPFKGADEGAIRLFVLGSCLGVILLQRKLFPLHGSAVAIHGKAYAFIGASGAGKSTLASELIKMGYSLLSDDVTAITLSEQSLPVVTPSYPQQKLWKETLHAMGEESSQYVPLYDRQTKFSVPVRDCFESHPIELAGIFELRKTDQGAVRIFLPHKIDQFQLLIKHTFRNFFIPDMGLSQWHFEMVARIVKCFDLYSIERPCQGAFSAHLIATQILDQIKHTQKLTVN